MRRLMGRVENAKGCHEDKKTRHEDIEYGASRIFLSGNRIQDLHIKILHCSPCKAEP